MQQVSSASFIRPTPPYVLGGGLRRFLLRLVLALLLLLATSTVAGCSKRSDVARSGGEGSGPRVVPTFTPTVAAAVTAAAAADTGTTTPGADPAPTATDTPTATPTQAPTATPTPTPEPVARLDQAHRLHRVGRYAEEREILISLLRADDPGRDGPEPGLLPDARFRLVESYLAEGQHAEAWAALAEFQAGADRAGLPDDDRRRVEGHFLAGEILMGLGRYGEAITAYRHFLTFHPELVALVQTEIATAYRNLGDAENAAVAYRQAADATVDLADRFRLLEVLAQVHRDAGRPLDAVPVYDEILASSQRSAYRASIQYTAGQVLAAAGHEEMAIARWRKATEEDPTGYAAYTALIELVERGAPFDLYRRGYIDLKAGAYIPGINAFQRFLEGAAADDVRRGAALHGIGQSYLGLENYVAAVEVLERVIAEYPDCACVGQAWLDKARAQAAAGDPAHARRTYRSFARARPDDPLAAEALWLSALSAAREGSDVEAAGDFLALANEFPDSRRAPAALYAMGLGFFARGLYAQAAEGFARLQQSYLDYRWQAVAYWLGRFRYAHTEFDAGREQWRGLVRREPDTYYGILAAQALARPETIGQEMLGRVAVVVGPTSTLAGDDRGRAFAEHWLAGWVSSGQPSSPARLSALPVSVAQDADLQLGQLLLELDRRAEALAALERVYQRYQDDPHALYALSLEFERLGTYRLSILSMARLLALSPARLLEDVPVFLQQRVYPRHFADLIEPEAEANGLDPLLLFSLIRQESLFEEGARSIALAQGLAQVIPDTGEWIAGRIGLANYTNALIYRPYINVKFGAYYLGWARDYLDGNLISALVGYNAGPGNVRYWRELAGTDDSLFVELLTVGEPRVYVQQVMANYYHYNRLYGKWAG